MSYQKVNKKLLKLSQEIAVASYTSDIGLVCVENKQSTLTTQQ